MVIHSAPLILLFAFFELFAIEQRQPEGPQTQSSERPSQALGPTSSIERNFKPSKRMVASLAHSISPSSARA